MERSDSTAVAQAVRTLFSVGPVGALTDSELLELFIHCRDAAAEEAFATLIERHGPMVLRVCKSVLRDNHDAEDAFQAAFLVLARRAGAIQKRESVAGWLFGVATRVATRARAQAARQRADERQRAAMITDDTSGNSQPELMPELREEVDRLAEKYRAPIVLCYFEGLTNEEAAQRLRLPVGTVKIRLARARERLRGRLTRRGLAPAGGLLAVSARSAQAAVPPHLAQATVQAAIGFTSSAAVSISSPAASIAKGALNAMWINKMLSTAGVVAASVFVATAVVLAWPKAPQAALPDPVSTPKSTPSTEIHGAMVIAGRDGAIELVRRTDLLATTTQPGIVEAGDHAFVFTRVTGYVASLEADVGDSVRRGQILTTIDAPDLKAELERARALISQAKARVVKAKAGVLVADSALSTRQAQLTAGKAEAEKEPTTPGNMAAEKAAEQTKANVQALMIHVREEEAKLQAARADIMEAEAALEVAQADAARAEALWSYTKVRSPIDGIVVQRTCRVGELVSSGMRGQAELFQIQNTQRVRIAVHVPDRDVPLVNKGDAATIRFDALPAQTFTGKVSRTYGVEDPMTGTLRVEIDLANPNGDLRSGQHGQVSIVLERRPHALVIPVSAVIEQEADGSAACFRVIDGRAVRTPIKLGLRSNQGAEVLEGLAEGDRVVTDPGPKVK